MTWLKYFWIAISTLSFSIFAGAVLLVTETWRECDSLEAPTLFAAIIIGSESSIEGDLTEDFMPQLIKAISLFQANKAEIFILSGGSSNQIMTENDAKPLKEYLISQGVPETSIFFEARASTTINNILFAKLLLDSLRCNEVFVITSKPQLCRALLITENFGIASVGIPSETNGGIAAFWLQTVIESFRLLFFLSVEQWEIPDDIRELHFDDDLRITSLFLLQQTTL